MAKRDKISKRVEKIIAQAEKKLRLDKFVKETASQVKKRTQLGYGVKGGKRGGAKIKLAPLSKSYRDFRAGNIAFITVNGRTIPIKPKTKPKLSRLTKPKKSNLTFTGRLLRALTGKVERNKMILYFKENRSDGVTNRELLDWHTNGTSKMPKRPFFELTKKEYKTLKDDIKEALIINFRRLNK